MQFHERLFVPLWLWAVALSLSVASISAVVFWIGPWQALVAGIVTALLVTWGLARAGSTIVGVQTEGIRGGAALLEWPYVGDVRALDVEETRRILGPDADPSAYVVQKPWLNRAVLVDVDDPADPHPYWLLCSRRPERIVAAANRQREIL